MFYNDKKAFDSKKFKMTLISMVAIVLLPIATRYLGPVAPTVVDQVAPYIADLVIGIVTAVYVFGQSKVDAAMAAAKNIGAELNEVPKTVDK
ncbi:MAG: hypothetical protein OEY10_00335 [Nitrosopumilus sp.]|nr:hypothetical protein [Nitrosopumilus sp.]